MTTEHAVSEWLAGIDTRLDTSADSTTRLAVLVDAGRQLARDLQAIDIFVGLPLMFDLDDVARELAELGVPDPGLNLPAATGDQARDALRAVLHVLTDVAAADDLPDDVRAVAARAGADAGDACLRLLGP